MTIGQWLFIGFIVVLCAGLYINSRRKNKTAMSSGKPVDFAIRGKLPGDDDESL